MSLTDEERMKSKAKRIPSALKLLNRVTKASINENEDLENISI